MKKHKQLLPLHSLIIGFTLAILSGNLWAQDTQRPHTLPRVGSYIDRQEAEYFQLFPDISGLHRNALSWLLQDGILADLVPGKVLHAAAHVTEAPGDSVRFLRSMNDDAYTDVRTVSSSAAAALSIYLEHFEEIRTMPSPERILAAHFLPDSLRSAVNELFEADILPSSWSAEFQDKSPSKVRVVRRDGPPISGYVLCVTNQRLALWTGKPLFEAAAADTALHILQLKDLDTMIVPSTEHATGLFAGLFTGLMLVGQDAVGRESDLNPTDGQFVFIQMLFIPPAVAGIGALLPMPYDDALRWDTSRSTRFSDSPIYEKMMLRPGLPPELRSLMRLGADEWLYRWPDDRLPIVPLPNQAVKMKSTHWSVGVEQLWLSADGLIGLRPGITAGYEYAYLRAPGGTADLGVHAAAAGGDDYFSAALRATARLGPLQIVAGYRAIWLPNNISVNSSTPSTGVGPRYTTKTTTTQHATMAAQYLHFELGLEIVVWDMAFGLHSFSQLTPSASTHEVSTSYSSDNTYERRQSNVRLGAFVLSMRYRF